MPPTSGIETMPEEILTLIVVPAVTFSPASGEEETILSFSMRESSTVVESPSSRPTPLRIVFASPVVLPERSGIATSPAPLENVTLTVEPASTGVPGAGFDSRNCPSGTVSLFLVTSSCILSPALSSAA